MKHNSYNLKDGQVLDLGAGNGWRSKLFAEEGNTVVAVDKNKEAMEKLEAEGILTTVADIKDFPINEGYFDVILLNNVLPFIEDKSEVVKIINRAFAGLKEGGYLEFTLFGMQDAWNGKPGMSFWSAEDIAFSFPIVMLNRYWSSEEQGMAPMQNGEEKFWHIYRFTLKK